jgi:amino acid transporter
LNWQNFIRGLIVSTLIFGGILLGLTFFSSPEKGLVTIVLYYVSVFFFAFGLAGMIGFTIRRWWMHNEMLFENVKISVRQGILLSGFLASLLALSAMRLLTWWDGLILAISFLLVEMYFKTRN